MNEGNISFPTETEVNNKLKESTLSAEFMNSINEALGKIISLNSRQPPQKSNTFIEKLVPSVLSAVLIDKKLPSDLEELAMTFLHNYVQVISVIDFTGKLFSGIANVMPQEYHEFKAFEFSPSNSENMIEVESLDEFLQPFVKDFSVFQHKILEEVYNTKLLPSFFAYCKSDQLTTTTISGFVQFIRCIFNLLKPKVASSVLEQVITAFIPHLVNNPDLQIGPHFIFELTTLFPGIVSALLPPLCEISKKQATSQSIIQSVIEKLPQSLESEIVKNTVIDILAQTWSSKHPKLIQSLAAFLPKIGKNVPFTAVDILKLISQKNAFDEFHSATITNLIQNLKEPADPIADYMITSDHFNARIIIALIDVFNLQNPISSVLFERLMRDQDKISPNLMKSLTMNEHLRQQINTAMENTENLNMIKKIAHFFKNAPYLKDTSNFLQRLANVSILKPELLPYLDMFSNLIPNIEIKNLLITMFKTILQSLFDAKINVPPGLIRIYSHWLAQTEAVPEKEIIALLSKVDYSKCPSALPILVDIVAERANERELIETFIFKIANDTVKPKLAKWAVSIIFRTVHSKSDLVHKIVELLVNHLSDPNKAENAARMIYESVLYESDFFDCKSPQSLSQQFYIKELLKKITLTFHPFHSTRHLYWKVAKDTNQNLTSFDLFVEENGQETPILYGMPMTDFAFSSSKRIKLITKSAENPSRLSIEPIFTRKLAQIGIEPMIKMLDFLTPETEGIFQVLMLLTPVPKFTPQNSLQKIVNGQGVNPIEFVGSSKVLPFAIALSENPLTNDEAQGIVEVLVMSPLDYISMSIAAKYLPKLIPEFTFTSDIVRRGLIMCRSVPCREVLCELAKKASSSPDPFIACMSDAIKPANRPNTRQFFEALKTFKLSADIFTQFFEDLVQYEDSYYSEPDETLIQLLSLIPKSDKNVELVIKRLFMMPTVKKPIAPFILSKEAREAAFNFLQTSQATTTILNSVEHLPSVPSVYLKFSDDFTYKARSGLYNLGSTCYLNAVFQCLNACSNFSNQLMSLEGDDYPPFVIQIRELLAKMRYTVEMSLSVRNFVETLELFNPDVQEDAFWFFNGSIIGKLSNLMGPSKDITTEFQGELEQKICSINDGKELSTSENSFYNLTIPINDLTNLDDGFHRYFSGYNVDYKDGEQNLTAICKPRITKWPNYLVIQLERYDYSNENELRIKLIHEFMFPIALDPNRISLGSDSVRCDSGYSLAGVIVHEGDVDAGHYFAIVQGEDREWYYINDHNVEYFDVTKMKQWAFGVAENTSAVREKVWTGYMLFYKRIDIKAVQPKLSTTLEELIDVSNNEHWPSSVFFSMQFLDFVMKHVKACNFSQESITLAFMCLFRVTVIKEEYLSKWCNFFEGSILNNKERCRFFIELIGKKLGKTFSNIISISDAALNNISNVVNKALDKLMDESKPIITLIRCTDEFAHKRSASFTLDIITRVTDFSIDWENEEELLLCIISFLENDSLKEVFKGISKAHSTAFAKLMLPIQQVLMSQSITAPIFALFSIGGINRLSNSARKSDQFIELLQRVAKMRPSMYRDQSHATQQTKQILQQITIPTTEDSDTFFSVPHIDTTFLWQKLSDCILSADEKERVAAARFMMDNIGEIHDNVRNYFEFGWAEGEDVPTSKIVESTFHQYIISHIPKCVQLLTTEPKRCTEYLDVLSAVSIAAPCSLSTELHKIFNAINVLTDENILNKLLTCIVRVIQYRKSFILTIDDEIIGKLLSLNICGTIPLYFIIQCKEKAKGTNLLRANIEYFLSVESSESCSLLAKYVSEYGAFSYDVPKEGKGFEQVELAVALWEHDESKRDSLHPYIESLINGVRQIPLIMKLEATKKALEILEA